MTAQTLKVLALFLEDLQTGWYGFDLSDQTGIKTGTLYPILIRLEKAGWLESRLENVDPKAVGRPRRRMYVLTGEGARAARRELTRHLEALVPASHPLTSRTERLA